MLYQKEKKTPNQQQHETLRPGRNFAFISTKASHVFLISQFAYAFSNTAVALYTCSVRMEPLPFQRNRHRS